VSHTTNSCPVVKDFDEAVLGQIAERANSALRDLKRSMRDQFGEAPAAPYTADQAGAAQGAITALAEVDRAFAGYRLPDSISYCDCCTDPELIGRLLSVSCDDLSEDDIASVAGSLLYTIGDANDLKYFVPRFCRDTLVVPLYDIDSVFARFRRAGFDEWPDAERRAVRNFLGAVWKSALIAGSRRNLSELTDPWLDILDSMSSLGFLGDALFIWDAEHGDAADSRLLDLLDALEVGSGSISVSGAGGFSDNSAAYDVLEAWLRSPAVRARIAAVLESVRLSDSELAQRIDSVLRALASRPEKGP
jgi:hypothetical protein